MPGVGLETLRRLLDEHTGPLVLYARQWCRTPEDIVQDVFLLLMREPVAPANPVAWLYRAVRNKALNAARAERRRAHHETAAAVRTEPWLRGHAADRLDAAAAAEALAGLAPEQREVIVARLWGGLSLEQVAELTGTSASTAYRWYQQGIAALRERLEGVCPEPKTNSRR
jgi:RNA polymerase sigma-70 factor (ECF subfamily)